MWYTEIYIKIYDNRWNIANKIVKLQNEDAIKMLVLYENCDCDTTSSRKHSK
jgi:hypothetical protein